MAGAEERAERAAGLERMSMRTLHFGLRVADLDRSLAFYSAVGYEVVGTVAGTAFGDLTMLKLPDDDFVTIELVSGSSRDGAPAGSGLNHFVIKVESLAATTAANIADAAAPTLLRENDKAPALYVLMPMRV